MRTQHDVLGERHHEKHRSSARKSAAVDHEQQCRPDAAGGSKGGGFPAGPVRAAHGECKGSARSEGMHLFEAYPAPFKHSTAEVLDVVSHLVVNRHRSGKVNLH